MKSTLKKLGLIGLLSCTIGTTQAGELKSVKEVRITTDDYFIHETIDNGGRFPLVERYYFCGKTPSEDGPTCQRQAFVNTNVPCGEYVIKSGVYFTDFLADGKLDHVTSSHSMVRPTDNVGFFNLQEHVEYTPRETPVRVYNTKMVSPIPKEINVLFDNLQKELGVAEVHKKWGKKEYTE